MTTTPDDIQKKIADLTKRSESFEKKKAGLQGQLQAKKEELVELIKEIRAAGRNPQTLAADKELLEKELLAEIATYEKDLAEAEKALDAFNKK
jgi:predicted RNase H-like nuclease (RuvC/YqgF family)